MYVPGFSRHYTLLFLSVARHLCVCTYVCAFPASGFLFVYSRAPLCSRSTSKKETAQKRGLHFLHMVAIV